MQSKAVGTALGVGLALAGVAIAEMLLFAGVRLLGPIGMPGLGMAIAAAFAGLPAALGGVAVVTAYYFVNLASPERFPQFYGSPSLVVAWITAYGVLCAAMLVFNARLKRARSQAGLAKSLEESEARLRLLMDSVPALVGHVDRGERLVFCNYAYEEWFGLAREKLIGRTVREAWGEERYAVIRPNLQRALGGKRFTYEYTFVDRQGTERHVQASYVPDTDAAGNVRGVFVLGTDVTSLLSAQAELRLANERLQSALEASSVVLWDADLRSGRVFLSEAWAALVGAPPGAIMTTVDELMARVHPDDLESVRRLSLEVLKGERPAYAVEHRVRTRSGEWKWILSRGRVVERDPQAGRALRMIGTNLDITERKATEEQARRLASFDALTGCASRSLFQDRLRQAIARARRQEAVIALLYVDLDRFKEVNDSLGHAAGDAVLREFGARLRGCVRESDTVARLGGDEFVILLDGVKDGENARRLAQKVLWATAEPVRADGRDVLATVSIGIALGRGESDADALMKLADRALYEAKAGGRNTFRVAA